VIRFKDESGFITYIIKMPVEGVFSDVHFSAFKPAHIGIFKTAAHGLFPSFSPVEGARFVFPKFLRIF